MEKFSPSHMQQSTTCLHFAWRTTSLRVGGLHSRHDADRTVFSCLIFTLTLIYRRPHVSDLSVRLCVRTCMRSIAGIAGS